MVNAHLTLGKMTVTDFQASIVWVECELGGRGRRQEGSKLADASRKTS